MGIISIFLFFTFFWGFGFGLLKLLRVKEGNFLERQLMRTGIGMPAVIITAIFLNLATIPLDWRIFLVISLLGPLVYLARNYRSYKSFAFKISLQKSDLNVFLVLLIFAASLQMYASGAFTYPYLEDDDPWVHAAGVKYVAEEKTFSRSPYREFQYMNPYPPGYEFIMALMHQTESSIQWTLKFFNALIISLSLVYFYFFARKFTGKRNKALFATFVLAAIPAYLSHFIWAAALAMTLFFPALYALEMTKHDKKWKWVAGVAIAGILVSQPTHAIVLFSMILAYLFVRFISEKDFLSPVTSAIGGIALSLSWWGINGKSFLRDHGAPQETVSAIQGTGLIDKIISKLPTALAKTSGTATRPYTFSDFFIAKGQNLINNPTGLGIAVTILAIIGAAVMIGKIIVSAKRKSPVNPKNAYLIITLLWFIFTFIIVNTQTFNLPVGFYGFRVWMIMAIPVALAATEGMWGIMNLTQAAFSWCSRRLSAVKSRGESIEIVKQITLTLLKFGKASTLILAIAGIAFTSAQQKYEVNTANWPPGVAWTSLQEVQTYAWLKNLPHDTKVFSFIMDDFVIGFDKFSCAWCEAETTYRQKGFNDSAEETALWMKENEYEYLILGGMESAKYGRHETSQRIKGLADSGLFRIAHQNYAVAHTCASDYTNPSVPVHNCSLEHTNRELVNKCQTQRLLNPDNTLAAVIHNCNEGLVHGCSLSRAILGNTDRTVIQRECNIHLNNLGIVLENNPDAKLMGAVIFRII